MKFEQALTESYVPKNPIKSDASVSLTKKRKKDKKHGDDGGIFTKNKKIKE